MPNTETTSTNMPETCGTCLYYFPVHIRIEKHILNDRPVESPRRMAARCRRFPHAEVAKPESEWCGEWRRRETTITASASSVAEVTPPAAPQPPTKKRK